MGNVQLDLWQKHESLQNALERIILDETGATVMILDLVGINKDLTFNNVNVDFICKYESGELIAMVVARR